jgi:hypothetical protein
MGRQILAALMLDGSKVFARVDLVVVASTSLLRVTFLM